MRKLITLILTMLTINLAVACDEQGKSGFVEENTNSITEADGEIVGTGSLKVHIIPSAIQFLINCI